MNSENSSFKFSAEKLQLLAIITLILDLAFERFGTYPSYSSGQTRYSNSEFLGVAIPILIFVLPIFIKNLRANFWSKKNLVVSSLILILSLYFILVMYANKEYYKVEWIENGHWEWSNSPPIHWDFWNIL